MKTTKTIRLALAFIALLLLVLSCCPCRINVRHYESVAEKEWHDTTVNNTIRYNFVVSFSDKANISKEDSAFLKSDSVKILDSCACGQLFQLNVAPDLIPEDLLASRPRDPKQEGATFYNLGFQLNTIPRNKFPRFLLIKKPGQIGVPSLTTKSAMQTQKVTVAVIDGGLPNNKTFQNNFWTNSAEHQGVIGQEDGGNCCTDDSTGYDFTTNSPFVRTPIDKHGSFVGQALLNSMYGGPEIAFMDIKIFDDKGRGNLFDALCAMDYAIRNKADFINLSWGYYRTIGDTLGAKSDSLLLHYIKKANNAGIPVFASAGNGSKNTDTTEYHYPSGFFSDDPEKVPPNLFSVAAMNQEEDSLENYSNFGVQSVLLSAQGTHAVKGLDLGIGKGVSGTSYAAPTALAYAIRLMANNPRMSMEELRECLLEKSIYMNFPIGSEGKINIVDTQKCNETRNEQQIYNRTY